MNATPLLRILVVDDHGDTREIMSRMLSMRNYEIAQAATMAQAIELFEDNQFDLVISDLGLPDGSGHELLRQMLQIRPVKAIALSGHGSGEDLERSKSVGFLKHLTKPVDFNLLDFAVVEVAGYRD